LGNSQTVTTNDYGKFEGPLQTGFPSNSTGPDPGKELALPTGGSVVIVPNAPCTKLCTVVFENPNGNWFQDPGEASILGVDVTFTFCYTVSPPPLSWVFCDIPPVTYTTDSSGMICMMVPDSGLYPISVKVNIDNKTLPPALFQNLGDNPTTHLVTCSPFPVWDINGYA